MEDRQVSLKAAINAICEDGTWLERQGCTEITMVERKQRDVDILEALPSAQPEPCEDAVSREDVINFLCDWICAPGVRCNESSDKCGCIRGIKALPPAQQEYEELTPEEAASEITNESILSAMYWLDVMIRLKQMGYAICRKR